MWDGLIDAKMGEFEMMVVELPRRRRIFARNVALSGLTSQFWQYTGPASPETLIKPAITDH
jgi:hypothetical protein